MAADTSANKKRKWDLDDQGKTHLESASKITKTTDEFSSKPEDSKVDAGKSALDAAAAKIQAILAQKGLKEATPGARDNTISNNTPSPTSSDHPSTAHTGGKGDGAFVKNIPINDLRNRYMVTRGATQAQIQRDTGADVTTRGKFYPDTSLATESEPPLYLHVSASSQESLDKAVAIIEDLIENAQTPAPAPPPFERREPKFERRIYEEKIFIGLESTPHFNLRAKIVGPQGAYVKHIQNETGTRVQLKGRGSGFYESSTGQEAEEDLHVHVTCTREDGLQKAVELTKDLIKTVKADYERAQRPSPGYGYYGRGGYHRSYHHQGYNNYYGQHGGQHGGHHGGHHGQEGGPNGPPQPLAPADASPSDPGAALSPTAAKTVEGEAAVASSALGTSPTAAPADPQAYGAGYDYSQYYQYYGQYQYDPNYYNYYYGSATAAGAQPPAPADYQPPQQPSSPPPPPPPSSGDQSYHAVPPPPPPQ